MNMHRWIASSVVMPIHQIYLAKFALIHHYLDPSNRVYDVDVNWDLNEVIYDETDYF